MNLKEFFKKVVTVLEKEGVHYALAGGLVASLYRDQERLTKDLDFLILSETNTEKKAIGIIESLNLEAHTVRKADLEGGPLFAIKRKNTTPYMVVGRAKGFFGLDFILPEMPWFETALTRSEQNKRDFGFGKVPCLMVEDIILSKFYSYKNDPTRFNDLDDLKSIFNNKIEMNLDYLAGQMQKLELTVPAPIKTMVPKVLHLISRTCSSAKKCTPNLTPQSER